MRIEFGPWSDVCPPDIAADEVKEAEKRAARTHAILAFIQLQPTQRGWVAFAELAEWFCNLTGRNAQSARDALRASLLVGHFGDRIMHVHPWIGIWRMRRTKWANIVGAGWPEATLWNQYLSCFWIELPAARRWFELQGLTPPAVLNERSTEAPTRSPTRPLDPPVPNRPRSREEKEEQDERIREAMREAYLNVGPLTSDKILPEVNKILDKKYKLTVSRDLIRPIDREKEFKAQRRKPGQHGPRKRHDPAH